jgi:hypothetical protein
MLLSQVRGEEPKPSPDVKSARRAEGALFNGRDLTGWKVAKDVDFKKHGEVRVMGDSIILALDAKRIDGNDFFCGLTFPVDKQYCTLILGGWGGSTTGLSNVNGLSADENETSGSMDFVNGQWYRVRLRVTPQKIQAWVDKEKVADLETEGKHFAIWWEQEPMRPLGIATWNTQAAVRNIHLKPL